MHTEVTLKIELGLPAQKIMSHMVHYHDGIEEEVKKGIDEALKELDIAALTKEGVKRDLRNIVFSLTNSYDLGKRIQEQLNAVIGNQIKEMAEQLNKAFEDVLNPVERPVRHQELWIKKLWELLEKDERFTAKKGVTIKALKYYEECQSPQETVELLLTEGGKIE